MLTDSQGLAQFYASVGVEGKRTVAVGPLLTGGEIPWQTCDTDAPKLQLNFTLPKTLVMEVVTANRPGEESFDAHLSWLIGEGGAPQRETGGQFLPLATPSVRIGGLVPGKKVSWKLTAKGRVETRMLMTPKPSTPSMIIPFGDQLSTVFLHVVDRRGKPFPPAMIGVVATPVLSGLPHVSSVSTGLNLHLRDPVIRPRPSRVRTVVGRSGHVDLQLDLARAYRLNFFVRRGVAGDFGEAHRGVKSLKVEQDEPGSFQNLGDVVLEFPAVEVEGQVLNASGIPVAGASVQLSSVYFPYQAPGKRKVKKRSIKSLEVETGSKGEFLIYLGQERGRGYTLKGRKGAWKSDEVLVDENSSPLLLTIH